MPKSPPPRPRRPMSEEKYAKLMAEAKAPYRGLRKFVYGAVGASGGIGAVVFLTQILAGREVGDAVPNFLLQIGLVALMVWLFRIDRSKEDA